MDGHPNRKLVREVDYDLVPLVRFDERSGELTIDGVDLASVAVGRSSHSGDIPPVFAVGLNVSRGARMSQYEPTVTLVMSKVGDSVHVAGSRVAHVVGSAG
jgi:hypothetical protein